jgi:hypothetical protein
MEMSRTFLNFFKHAFAAPILPHQICLVNTFAQKTTNFLNYWSTSPSQAKPFKNGHLQRGRKHACAKVRKRSAKTKVQMWYARAAEDIISLIYILSGFCWVVKVFDKICEEFSGFAKSPVVVSRAAPESSLKFFNES